MSFLKKIRKIVHLQETLAQTFRPLFRNAEFKQQRERMTELALHCKEKGVTDYHLSQEEIIVSLTTYGARFYDVYLTIESIMQGTIKPNRIVLWVSEELKSTTLPIVLARQIERGLEIRYRRDLRSFTKLLYSLKEFPDATIVTIDDDVIYNYDFLETLVNTHNAHPGMICANMIKPITKEFVGQHLVYARIPLADKYETISDKYIVEGYAGVLYPPKALHSEVFNEEVFMEISKYADDIWFSAMAMLQHTQGIYAYPHLDFFSRYISNDEVQSVGLKNINKGKMNLDDVQLNAVFKAYNLL